MVIDLRLELSSIMLWRKCKLVKCVEWNLDQKEGFSRYKKLLIVTIRHEKEISVVAKQNWRNGEEATDKIVDVKLHSEDTLKKSKTISLQSFESDNDRSSHSEVFLEKSVLKICRKFTGEHPCRSAILLKSHFGMGVLL